MLLGVPCVAADVGGVTTMMRHRLEGEVYPSTAPYMLAFYVENIFAQGEAAEAVGAAARAHAGVTHDPEKESGGFAGNLRKTCQNSAEG